MDVGTAARSLLAGADLTAREAIEVCVAMSLIIIAERSQSLARARAMAQKVATHVTSQIDAVYLAGQAGETLQ